MVLIRVIADDGEALTQRLTDCQPGLEFAHGDGDADLRIYALSRWQPSWSPSPAKGAVLLLSPREPADPAAAFVAGIDAWLPSDCSDNVLCRQVRALLARVCPDGASADPGRDRLPADS